MRTGRAPRLLSHPLFKVAMAVASVLCAAPGGCSGGGAGSANGDTSAIATSTPAAPTVPTANLTASDVNTIMLQAINEASPLAYAGDDRGRRPGRQRADRDPDAGRADRRRP